MKTVRMAIKWNLEPDSKKLSRQEIADAVKRSVGPGSIILLHAMYKGRCNTLKAIPEIIEWLQAKGYTLVRIDELLSVGGAAIR